MNAGISAHDSYSQYMLYENIPSPTSSNYVTVCSEGNQLGGQLTTYAVVLGYAWSHGLTPIFSKEKLLNIPGGQSNYEYIFHRLPQDSAVNVSQGSVRHHSFFNGRNPWPYKGGNICICTMPTYPLDFFNQFREKIRKLFAPSELVIAELRSNPIHAHIMDHPRTVAVHVRAYHPSLSMHWCLGKEYFENAMDIFNSEHLFVIFSDRIDWCKEHLDLKGKHAFFIEGNNHIQDFYLMSFCKNIITANSTFSWWAAYLKQDEEGLIFVPEKWFQNEMPSYRKTFYPSHYKILPIKNIPKPDWNLVNYPTKSLGD
jgi:hypothetical protein